MTIEKIKVFIDNLADDEIATAIALGKQTIASRFDARMRSLEADRKRLLKDADTGRTLKPAKEEKSAAAA